jgi:hypothetical protein
VTWVSYKPPPFARSLQDPIPRVPSEQDYFNTIYNPMLVASYGDTQPPFEIYLAKELTNPHSRIRKVARFKEALARRKNLLKSMVAQETKDLSGRSKKEAVADARWKWRELLATEAKDTRKKRWVQRGAEAKLEKKMAKRAKKMEKKMDQLTQLSLKSERHQFIPPAIRTT